EQGPFQLQAAVDRLVADTQHHVTLLQPRAARRAVRLHAIHHQLPLQDSRFQLQVRLLRTRLFTGDRVIRRGDAVLADEAVPGAVALADAEHVGGHAHHRVNGNGEADALGAGADGHVDADQFTVDVDERAARVARVDAGVGLDQLLVRHFLV